MEVSLHRELVPYCGVYVADYPCPLISVRFRKPVFGEIGHTIMNLLADFRKFQYMLPQIKGVTIHMEDKKTYINFPRNRYDAVSHAYWAQKKIYFPPTCICAKQDVHVL